MDGLPRECETKKSQSDELIMLLTSKLIGGIGGAWISTGDGGGPLSRIGSSLTTSLDTIRRRLLPSNQGKGLNLLFNLESVGKWKSQKSPKRAKCPATAKGLGGSRPFIPASL